MKPTMEIVRLQHQYQLLAGSLTSTTTNLDTDEDIDIDDSPKGIWGR